MTVNRIRAPHNRDARATTGSIHRRRVIGIRKRNPIFYRGVFILLGKRTSPIEHTTQTIDPDILRGDIANLTLNHLADFLLHRHLRSYGIRA